MEVRMDSESDLDSRESHGEADIAGPLIQDSPTALPIRGQIRKRPGEEFVADTGLPPSKRAKGGFNAAYLSLLNQDIQDASSGLIHDEKDSEPGHTQIGAVVWSAAEKRVFFAAVSRLGRDDAIGISTRIGTKSEVEVQQYLVLLDESQRQQLKQQKRGREGRSSRYSHALRPIDIPAAVEIGAECAAALEAAADAISLRQEGYEEEVEKERWGSRWLVTAPLARTLENTLRLQKRAYPEASTPQPRSQSRERGWGREEPREEGEKLSEKPQRREDGREEKGKISDELPFLQLFPLQNWLRLSDRVFMNSAVSDGNWHAVPGEPGPPAIRATVFADFYRLALSVTRRLLLVTMYVAEARLRPNSSNDARRIRRNVRVEDVVAAVSSLGMKQNSREFWARCARRLRLNIVDDEDGEEDASDGENEVTDPDEAEGMANNEDSWSLAESEPDDVGEAEMKMEGGEEDDDHEHMSYDEVEAALGYSAVDNVRNAHDTPEALASTVSEDEADEAEQETEGQASGHEDPDHEDDGDIEMGDVQGTTKHESDDDDDGLNADAVQQDVEETILSLASGAGATPNRKAIASWIRAEHKAELDAERVDSQASADAEAELWAMLRGDDGNLRKTKGHKG